jgi:hypothetical protein
MRLLPRRVVSQLVTHAFPPAPLSRECDDQLRRSFQDTRSLTIFCLAKLLAASCSIFGTRLGTLRVAPWKTNHSAVRTPVNSVTMWVPSSEFGAYLLNPGPSASRQASFLCQHRHPAGLKRPHRHQCCIGKSTHPTKTAMHSKFAG